ncbi:response regulator [Motiliproteus sp. MSK22-1]|uniref:response regulator n=1 Tax=Motiliproteus sp. MSK22-1 TaxID=1897630 RepID=UPI000978C3AD|nr:response regulator [Motiliproteus sp. MSK22-1]OMH25893.1 hypothetical protein BGP75_25620 [Motiliproteus sp. MSK22-1]
MDINRERTLLLVDDEENIIRSLRRLFRREGYRILTANSGKEGLQVLEQESVGVIVSDQRMPEMTGSEFLHQVTKLYPDTVRLILSGYTDLESVTDSINRGAIYKFLTKPWEDDLLCQNVREAFRIFELNEENLRLTEALKVANQELEQRVEKKTRELQFNVQALKISQDILEELPMTVLGVSEGLIIVANQCARELFSESPLLMGMPLDEVCPEEVVNVYEKAVSDGELALSDFSFKGNLVRCQCQRNTSDGPHEGFILTMRQVNI